MKKELFEELLQSVKQAKAIEKRQLKPARVFRVNAKTDIVLVRAKLGLSQSKFAAVLGISADTLQNWEQGRRSPTGPAKVLLEIAARHPELLLEVPSR
jgi:putative transcriptional regulator